MTVVKYYKTLVDDVNIDTKSPYVVIHHKTDTKGNKVSIYLVVMVHSNLIIRNMILKTSSKDEVKIWLDLNGYKLMDKIVIYDKGLCNIQYEMFKLERI